MKRSTQQKTLALFLMTASLAAAASFEEPAAAEDTQSKGKPQWAKTRGVVTFIDIHAGRIGVKEPGGAILVYTFTPDVRIRRNHATVAPAAIAVGEGVQFLRYDRRNRRVERMELMALEGLL